MDTLSSILWIAPAILVTALLVTGLRGAFTNTQNHPPKSSRVHATNPKPPHSPRKGTLDETLVEEGLGTRDELAALAATFPTRSILLTLVDQGRIDERRFTSIWARHSGLASTIVTPEDIAPELLELWPEQLARRFRAIPFGPTRNNAQGFAFVEPPDQPTLREIETITGKLVSTRLITPKNLLSLCDEIYPAFDLKNRNRIFQPALDSLQDSEKRNVREFQMTNRVSLGEALEHHGALTPTELGMINSAALEVDHVPLDGLTLSVPMLRTLSPLFCELHGILPLNNGALAINHPLHPHTTAKIQTILGNAFAFQADNPASFMRLWRDFTALRFSQDALIDHLVCVDLLTIKNAEHIREARRLLAEPIDRVLLKLRLASPRQIFHAIRTTSSLDIARTHHPAPPSAERILTAEHRARSGIQASQFDQNGVTFHIARLPSTDDATEIMRRCDGVPWKFELSPALLDTPA